MKTLLLTVDALRADHLGQYGYERDTMPVLDDLVEDGTRFTSAFANGTYTRISVPSFQTSQYLAYENLEAMPKIAPILEDGGIETAVIGTQTGIGLVHGGFGYGETIDLGRDDNFVEANADRPLGELVAYRVNKVATRISQGLQHRGADRLYDLLKKPYRKFYPETPFEHSGYTSAKRVTDRVIDWFEDTEREDSFLWVHYMEAHRPYGVHDEDPAYLEGTVDRERLYDLMKTAGTDPDQVSESDRQLMIDLYDSDVRYCSRHISRLFDYLREKGHWDETNIVFSSDHGEELYEHGKFFHRNYPYDELLHVPLIIKRAEDSEGGDVVAGQRQLLDLAPTICAFHGLDPDDFRFLGTPLFEGDSREVIALGQPNDQDAAVAVRYDGWKYIDTGDDELLFELSTDPDETENVVADNPDVAARLSRCIPDSIFERDVEDPRVPEDEVDREHLEALGYMELREED
ncbi:arylsulfatase [Halomicrobium zhouii]|uniref:Arylsulfatase n=1 Tax=Halomicrobium zhouii TaxID=767519 RepID=A0A1I6LT88_9EURY|nr:sulfatase [Halomicrobium zhouii]SFS06540.1 arylsulfatase [Halomicrobium zhouii]